MKIVCLVKQVPRPDSIEFDAETKALRREGVPLLLNPFDAAAVAHAAAHEDAEVIAMTMGPPQAEAALRTCRQAARARLTDNGLLPEGRHREASSAVQRVPVTPRTQRS